MRVAECWVAGVLLGAGISAMAAPPDPRGLTIGKPVPPLEAVDLEGVTKTLNDFPGKVRLVLFWHPKYRRSEAALCGTAELAKEYDGAALVTVVSGPSDRDELQKSVRSCGLPIPVLLDPDRANFGRYQIVATPSLLIVSADGKLLHRTAGFGREGLGAVRRRLDELFGKARPVKVQPAGDEKHQRRLALARQLLRLGMTDQAAGILKTLTSDAPDFRPAWVELGYLEVKRGEIEAAERCFQRAIELQPDAADIAAGMSWVWRQKGDQERAGKWAAKVPSDDPHRDLLKPQSQNGAGP